MFEVARAGLAQMPPASRLRESDALLIQRHREPLLALEKDVVKAFYDTVYAHPATAAILADGDRSEREAALGGWWRRTVTGPLDDEYFAWMAFVGLVHVARHVTNPMMLAMTTFVSSFVADRVPTMGIDRTDGEALVEAFLRFSATAGSVISYGYDRAYERAVVTALYDVAGMPETLFQRIRDREVMAALEEARAEGAQRR